MTTVEIIITVVLRVPDVVGGVLQIGSALTDWVLVETIETGLIDDVEDGLMRIGDGQ